MNVKLKDLAPFSDSDHELETAKVSFSQNGQQICESQGLNSLKEKLNDIKPKLSVI